jgi:hypothetical protein
MTPPLRVERCALPASRSASAEHQQMKRRAVRRLGLRVVGVWTAGRRAMRGRPSNMRRDGTRPGGFPPGQKRAGLGSAPAHLGQNTMTWNGRDALAPPVSSVMTISSEELPADRVALALPLNGVTPGGEPTKVAT